MLTYFMMTWFTGEHDNTLYLTGFMLNVLHVNMFFAQHVVCYMVVISSSRYEITALTLIHLVVLTSSCCYNVIWLFIVI